MLAKSESIMTQKTNAQSIFLAAAVLLSVVVLGGLGVSTWLKSGSSNNGAPSARRPESLEKYAPYDGNLAYQHLNTICGLGKRISGSPGMIQQQQYLAQHFQKHGGQVARQEFQVRHPENGTQVTLTNLIASWHPERKQRLLLCAHYDTRPFPDQDPVNPRGTFIGANDGASGVALLCELARHIQGIDTAYGIDIVMFDGEEFIFDSQRDAFFLGSEHFAKDYANNPRESQYRWGVLLDMVGDQDLQIYQERNSLTWKDTRPLVQDIWRVARDLGISEFKARGRHTVNDDHVPLHDIGGISICDIIDFDYPNTGYGPKYWHTERDVPEMCSAASLAKVGKVMLTWLERVK